jgi:hypothetical protein
VKVLSSAALVIAGAALALAFVPSTQNVAATLAVIGVVLGVVAWIGTRPEPVPALTGLVLSLIACGVALAAPQWFADRFGHAPATAEGPGPDAGFGDALSWPDGLTVTVAPPVPYRPSSDSDVTGFHRAVLFRITVANNSSQPVSLGDFRTEALLDGQDGQQLTDSANNLGRMPDTTLAPGHSGNYRAAFTIQSAPAGSGQLQVRITPDSGAHPAATAEGRY